MREIEFRAWFLEVKGDEPYPAYMCYDVHIRQMVAYGESNIKPVDRNVTLDLYVWNLNQLFEHFGEHAILEEYTGLKDTAGKKIFEGDILRWANQKTATTVQRLRLMEAKFDDTMAAFILVHKDRKWFFGDLHRHYEVVGNIHENAELLQDKE